MPSALKSFIEVGSDSHFPIQNLPFGVFKPGKEKARVGVAIGESVLDLSVLEERGYFRLPKKRDDLLPALRDAIQACMHDERCW